MCSLKTRTLSLLQSRNRDNDYRNIAALTGLKPTWVASFAQGRIKEPSVDKVETLYQHLSGKQLDLG